MCDDCPYVNDIDLLDDHLTWLHARARRIAEDRDPPPIKFPIQRVKADEDWKCREQSAWRTIQVRLAAHGDDPKAPTLGLELLRDEHGLDDNEILVLVACTAVAVSQHLANQVLGDLCGAPYGIQIEDLWALMNPCCRPWGLEQSLAFRRYFRPGGRLVDSGLVSVEVKEGAPPAELSGAWVQLTEAAFKAITGVAS